MPSTFRLFVHKVGISTLIYSAILLLLAIVSAFSFDLIGFFAEHKYIHKTLAYTVIASSILFIPRSNYWMQLTLHKKLLVLSIVLLLTAINFKLQQSFQFSIVFALAAFYYYSIEKRFYKPNIVYILMMIYFVHLVISLSWSLNKAEGYHYIGRLTPLFFIPLLFSLFRLDKKDFELILAALFKIATLMAVLSIASWILQSRFNNVSLLEGLQFKKTAIGIYPIFEATYAWALFKHPTYWSILFLTVLASGWFYLNKKDTEFRIRKSEMLFALMVILIITSISASRVMLVNFVLINTIGLLYTLRHNKKTIVISSITAAAIAVLIIVLFNDKIMAFINDPVRFSLRAAAYESISQNTWQGTGFGGMIAYLNIDNPLLSIFYPQGTDYSLIHPHNQFIGDMMQTGIVGLSIITLLTTSLIYKSLRNTNGLLTMVLIMYLFIMIIEMPLFYVNGIFAFASYISFFTHKESIE